jgi:hypothetical protein
MGSDERHNSAADWDWLTDWDQWAAEAEPFQDAIGLPYFVVVRYPRLMPRSNRRHYALVLRLSKPMTRKIQPLCVLKDLSPRQSIQLGALLFDIDAAYGNYRDQKPGVEDLRKGAKQGLGKVRRLNQKLKKAADALDDLATYVEELYRRSPAFYSAIDAFAFTPAGVRRAAVRCRSNIIKDEHYPALQERLDRLTEPDHEFRRPRAIKADATEWLTSFFVTECGCSRKDADLRASTIGNHLWSWEDKIREKHEDEEHPRAAEAARSRRRRKSRPRS